MDDAGFDVIVVGAGSSGAVLAARLSEDASCRVLLLEAGRDWRAAEAPAALRSANILPFMHERAHQAAWQWPQLMARRTAVQQPRFYWRGRALGGSSTVNAQIAIRGVPEAFDDWAERGCEGWSADEVMPLFRLIEDDGAAGHAGGPLPVYRAPLERWGAVDLGLRDAALALGYPPKADVNAPEGEGVSANPINSRDGQRVTTNDAYLEPARGRPNLVVRGGALVDRVVFDGARRATGVRVRFGEGAWQDVAGRRVVLSAGAIHSPAILMRSGVGPGAALQALGIGVVHDQPSVGRNLMDHPIVRATLALRPEHRVPEGAADARHTNCCVTYSSGLGGGGDRDMILVGYNHRYGSEGAKTGAVGAALYNAFSRGVLSLASADPAVDPVVEENMLSDPRDLLRMRDAVGRLAALCAQGALRRLAGGITFGDTGMAIDDVAALPGPALDALLLQEAGDIQHAAGTCHMTAHEDPRGVVDPDLSVRGVAGLSVCDASVMPTDCRANLHFTCVMIGENLARRVRRHGFRVR